MTAVEKQVLKKPIQEWEAHFLAREKWDITKPVPYDIDEAYDKKRK